MMTRKKRIIRKLRFLLDRIDPDGAPRLLTAATFTFEEREGIRFRNDHQGCQLWYFSTEYDKAFDEADTKWG